MKQLASYFGVSLSAAYKWSDETIRRKTIIMESGAEPEIIKLIGEISILCYIFDCKHVVGINQRKYAVLNFNSSHARFFIHEHAGGRVIFQIEEIPLNLPTAVAELQKVKATLESFIY